jgi:Peptidase inhibitor family I36
MIRRMTVVLACLVAIVGIAAEPAAAAKSSTDSVQSQINDAMRKTPGGTQINANQVAWRNGTVILTIPEAGRSTTSLFGGPDCSSGWYCFYADVNWGGRRLQFSFYNELIDLANWGFTNQASSWHDNSGIYVTVWDGGNALWNMWPYSSSSWVGSAANDRADHFYGCMCG